MADLGSNTSQCI